MFKVNALLVIDLAMNIISKDRLFKKLR